MISVAPKVITYVYLKFSLLAAAVAVVEWAHRRMRGKKTHIIDYVNSIQQR